MVRDRANRSAETAEAAHLQAAVEGRRASWRSGIWGWLAPAALVAGLLGLWELLARVFSVPGWLLPPPSAIGAALGSNAGLLARHGWVTLQEVLVGLAVALGSGVGLALAIGYWRTVARAVYPLVVASQTIPIVALAPLLLVWIGYDLTTKVVVVALISFFPVVVNMVDGLRAVDPEMANMLRSLGASRWQVFWKVQAPTSLPYLFSGGKVAAAVSVIGAVIGEWVGSSAGLGWLMVQAAPRFQTALVFASILVLSVIGIGLFLALSAAERAALPWHFAARASQRGTVHH